MTRITMHGRMTAGKLDLDRESLASQLATLPDGEVVVKVQTQTRSERQNRLYWMYLTMLEDATGHSKDELHEIFRAKFNARTVSTVDHDTGEIIDTGETYPSTTDLDTAQFTAYIENIRRFAAEFLNVILPDPP
jgi:hypothetical protein